MGWSQNKISFETTYDYFFSVDLIVVIATAFLVCNVPVLRFEQWDPMITTPPGLYLASVGVIKPVVWLADLTGNVVCSTAMLRFINLLFNCGNLYLIYLLLCKLHPREKVKLNQW